MIIYSRFSVGVKQQYTAALTAARLPAVGSINLVAANWNFRGGRPPFFPTQRFLCPELTCIRAKREGRVGSFCLCDPSRSPRPKSGSIPGLGDLSGSALPQDETLCT